MNLPFLPLIILLGIVVVAWIAGAVQGTVIEIGDGKPIPRPEPEPEQAAVPTDADAA